MLCLRLSTPDSNHNASASNNEGDHQPFYFFKGRESRSENRGDLKVTPLLAIAAQNMFFSLFVFPSLRQQQLISGITVQTQLVWTGRKATWEKQTMAMDKVH